MMIYIMMVEIMMMMMWTIRRNVAKKGHTNDDAVMITMVDDHNDYEDYAFKIICDDD